MSFITKRERVFNEYVDPFDCPPRNEGKLKAYASCTDARAWSHFCSDKTEHLVEIIKRNNEVGRGKYVPTHVIVETLMAAKNAEINRLRRKIGELEQMMAVFDELELSCDQKCEIATAHAMIKAANRSLDELALDLDTSNVTEGIDSEGFLTGKSGGDEASGKFKGDDWSGGIKGKASKVNQYELQCTCDASTSAYDVRLDELEEALISKDAKLNAMQNTIAVMENDVCEPYCIYAHIYTALEKIFATLRQNEKYRLFLDLMSSGKDTRCIDIKGKILFKLKILEKFGIALLAPCSERFKHDETCECYTAQVLHFETTYALTSSEAKKPGEDSKRAQLVADIMQNNEMKEILSKDSLSSTINGNKEQPDDLYCIDEYSIDSENLNRLKSLQLNYNDLMTCYENIKHERDNLKIRCVKYEELEHEADNLRAQLREYNLLYNEREYYRKRSEGIDNLKERYIVLSDETSNLETQLKAEAEINSIKSSTIEDLRAENITLEKKYNQSIIAFEKEKNALQCKLKETECKIMCQDQQIRSLSLQIDRIIEQDHDKEEITTSVIIMDEIEALKEEVKHLKESLLCSEEEKQQLQSQFEDNLKLINGLKMEIEDWKCTYKKTLQRNEYLENYTEGVRDDYHKLVNEMSLEAKEESSAVANLLDVVRNKSLEINKLMDEVESKTTENKKLLKLLQEIKDKYESTVMELECEKKKKLDSLQLTRHESKELLEKVRSYDDLLHNKEDISNSLKMQAEDYHTLKNNFLNTVEENKKLQQNLQSQENKNSILLQEIQRVQNNALDNINSLQNERYKYQLSLELANKDSKILQDKLKEFEDLKEQMVNLKLSNQKLLENNSKLESDLQDKARDLNDAACSIEITKKESEHLLQKVKQSENLKEDMIQMSKNYQKLVNERQNLQTDLHNRNKDLENLLQNITELKKENQNLFEKANKADRLKEDLSELTKAFHELTKEKSILQTDLQNKTDEINNLYNTLENKIEENRNLLHQINSFQNYKIEAKNNIEKLKDVNLTTQSALNSVKTKSEELLSKIKNYETILQEFDELKQNYQHMELEKEKLKIELDKRSNDLKMKEQENKELQSFAENILSQNNNLEKTLISTKNELQNFTQTGPYGNILLEIEEIKKEKKLNQIKIRDLSNKLDESDNIISDLSEDLLARDDKIAILENHINSLEVEVRRLHKSLEEVVTAGEEIKNNSYKKIDQTLHKMEAHHSKATHNMKIELTKLKNENYQLEKELSVTKIKSEESFRDQHKYMSQIIHLQNERAVIVTDIKQLELTSVGDSNLSPLECKVEDILKSLDRIRKCLDAKHSKSTTLEQTLLKVQTSSQLLLSKADEAKRLVEKEKQKIITEKEDAISARLNMERQLLDLKGQLELQNKNDKTVIKELEAELLNQELIISKFKETTESYIQKLKEDMQSLQNLYSNSINTINELQTKIQILAEDKGTKEKIIDKINAELLEKSKDIESLQKKLDALNTKTNDVGIQVGDPHIKINAYVQVENAIFRKNTKSQTDKITENTGRIKAKDDCDLLDMGILKVNKPTEHKINTDCVPSDMPQSINEVQILTANIEPTLDYVKSSYVDYKIKRLSPIKLEQYSIFGFNDNSITDNLIPTNGSFSLNDKNEKSRESVFHIPNFSDIYKSQSMPAPFSKAARYVDGENITVKHTLSRTKSSITEYDLTNENSDFMSSLHDKSPDSNVYTSSSPGKSTDKELFLIYQDSESSHVDKIIIDETNWLTHRQRPIFAEALTVKPNKEPRFIIKQPREVHQNTAKPEQKDAMLDIKRIKSNENLIKHQLQIDLPRVENDTMSSDTEQNSPHIFLIDSSHSSQREDYINKQKLNQESAQNPEVHKNNLNQKPRVTENVKDNSHHKLLRVDADFLLFKDTNDDISNEHPRKIKNYESFGLEYILNSVKQELNFKNIKDDKLLRKSHSDDFYSQTDSPTKISLLNMQLSEHKRIKNLCPSKWSDHSQAKSIAKQNADINVLDYYENKIRRLTHILENTEKDYKKKLDAIKIQYDNNIKNIINEHNQGVISIQSLHEETLQDIIKIHENEVENLRTMSIEAMRKTDRLKKENLLLKSKIQGSGSVCLDKAPIKISTIEIKKRKLKFRDDTRMLTKTNVEAFNVKPKLKFHGPCTCSLDVNLSDTIRNIFEQVDVEQKKLAEHTYIKYIANKIMTSSVESLDTQELSFLHLKVCRTWKSKLNKEELLQRKIDSLENELVNKQRNPQHIAELDRKVAEQRQRLHEVREAVCRNLDRSSTCESRGFSSPPPAPPPTAIDQDLLPCSCKSGSYFDVNERRSAGDLLPGASGVEFKYRRSKKPESRAVLAKLDVEERREKKLYDEHPTRLRRAHDRSTTSRSTRK